MKVLPIEDLCPGMELAEALYTADGSIVPILSKGTVLSEGMIRRLKGHGIVEVRITGNENQNNTGASKAENPVIPKKLRKEALKSLESLFNLASLEGEEAHKSVVQNIKQVQGVVQQLVNSLLTNQNALINIADLKSYDEYTYHHSLSVAVMSIAIGQRMGLSKDEISLLGNCAMMHDIGKTAVPVEVLNKPDRLNADELRMVREHALKGYQYLTKYAIGDEEFRRIVLFHHERYDGKGYPKGLKRDGIPLMSRIISVADVYDALTSIRPYRMPVTPGEAVEYIMANTGTAFDHKMVSALLQRLELYPTGSFVELSNGQIARVLNSENGLRPVVQLIKNGEVCDLFKDHTCLNMTVKHALSAEELPAARQAPAESNQQGPV